MDAEYHMRGAANSLQWATLLDDSTLSMALKWPTVILRKLPNTSSGSYVLLLKMLLIVLNGPSILCVQVLPIPWNGLHFCTGYGIELAHIPLEAAAKYLSWDMCPTLKDGVDCFEWAQHFVCELLPISWNGPHVLIKIYWPCH
jgi:hypothetical protein